MKWWCIALFLPLWGLAIGCDDRSNEIPPPTPQANADQPRRPTTQFLENSPRNKIQLAGAPLTLMVPPGWEVKSPDSDIDTLEGPAPTADIEIQIVRSQLRPTKDQLAIMLAALATPKDPHTTVRIEDHGDVKVANIIKSNQFGDEEIIDWRVRTFSPASDRYLEYDLTFIGLSREDYDQNKDFLEKILSSLAYERADDMP